MSLISKQLRFAQRAWKDVEAPEGGGVVSLEDGKYRVEITGAEIKKDKSGGHGILLQFTVLKGEHEGKKQSKWLTLLDKDGELADEERVKWTKKDLAILLGEPPDLSELEDILGDLLEKHTEIFVKTNAKGNTNVYINEMAAKAGNSEDDENESEEKEDEEEEAPRKKSKKTDDDDEDDDSEKEEVDEDEEEDEAPKKKSSKKDEDEEEDEEPAPKKKKKVVDEDEEEEDAEAEVDRLLNGGKKKSKVRK